MGKTEIYNRDKDDGCFYCGKPLTEDEASLEHLLASVHGGNNDKNNLTIACKEHNLEGGASAIVRKVKLRDDLRGKVVQKSGKSTVITVGSVRIEVKE